MFLFDQATSSILFDGVPAIGLGELSVRAVVTGVAGEAAIELLLKSVNMQQEEDGNGGVIEYRLRYEDEPGTIESELLLKMKGRFLSVHVEAFIRNTTAYHAQRRFVADGGIRLLFRQLNGLQGLLATSRHKEWWTRPHFDPDIRLLPARTQSLLWKNAEGYGYMLPICTDQYRTDLAGTEEGLNVLVSTGEAGHETIRTIALVLGADIDPYQLTADTVHEGFEARNLGGAPRVKKAYPELMDYIGWCSWDAFYSEVDEKGLVEKAAELNQMGLPVRWFMIDDGWSDVRDKKLVGFGADKAKFPGGLERTVRLLKEEQGLRWVGAWHNIAGYWGGIDPDGTAFAEARPFVHQTRTGRWLPHPETAQNFGFWQIWHSALQKQGIDFVKVDNQSSLYAYFAGEESIARIARSSHIGLEASVALYFGGNILNCMGMASENVWNRPLSSVSRSSNDFLPKIVNGFGEHALQNAYNSVYHGPFYWGDWDMWWTAHHDAVPHMVLRAVSGGPIYFSDGLGRTRPELIRPLIYSDGRIIRCEQIGRPTQDWLTVNPLATPQVFKVWNNAGGAGVVAAFHVFDGEQPVEGTVGPRDISGIAGESFIVFDSFQKKAHRLQAGESLPVRLAPLEAGLYLVHPVTGPLTPIGLTDKLVASDAVGGVVLTGDQATVQLKDGGVFSFVSEREPRVAFVDQIPARIEVMDSEVGLYQIVCPVSGEGEAREKFVRIEY